MFGTTPVRVQDLQQLLLGCRADWLILQVPSHAVFEGELLCMQCRGWEPGSVTSVQYFRDGADITTRYASDKQLCIPRAETQQSGRYRCTGQMNSFLSVIKRESQELHVCIRGKKFLGVFGPSQKSEGVELCMMAEPGPCYQCRN